MGPESTLRARARPPDAAAGWRAGLERGGRLTGPAADRLAWVLLGLLLVVAAAFLYHETRGTTFWVDDWDWLQHRRAWDLDSFLRAHNGHLSLIPVAIYKILFSTAGLNHFAPYRAVLIAGHLLCGLLVFVYARRRVGAYLALLAALVILFFGPGWQNILSPFQVSWLISLAAGIGALLMLDRADRRGDIAASVLLATSIASSSLGIAVALGMAVELAWGRRAWRAAWIVAAPLVLYAVWWVPYHDTSAFQRHNVVVAAGWVADAWAAVVSGLAGLQSHAALEAGPSLLDWGRPLAIVALGLIAWRLASLWPASGRVLGLLTIALSFWILTALNRAEISGPFASRYVYVGALVAVLLAAELARGISVPARVEVPLALLLGAAVVSNIGTLRDGARVLRTNAQEARAAVGALEAGRSLVKPGYVLTSFPGYPFVVIRAGSYFAATKAYGSPAATPARIAGEIEDARRTADSELIRIHGVGLAPLLATEGPGPLPRVDTASGGSATRRGPCVTFRSAPVQPPGTAKALDVTLPPGGVRLTTAGGSASVSVRRFASEFAPVGTAGGSAPVVLRIGPDLAPQPWHARIVPADRATVCGLA